MAACRGLGPDLFFPEAGPGLDNHGTEAKAVCVECPVRVECLDEAVRNGELGIWGGVGYDRREGVARVFRSGDANAYRRALIAETAEIGRVFKGYDSDAPAAAGRPCSRCGSPIAATEPGRPHPADRNGPGATCGLAVTYNKGCRCLRCIDGKGAYHDWRKSSAGSPRAG